MRKLVVTENITLDGVIDAAEGWFAPSGAEEVDQSDLNTALREQAEAADALLLGRAPPFPAEIRGDTWQPGYARSSAENA